MSNVYILLDRSASMGGRMNGAIQTINEYVGGLPKDAKVTLATFDTMSAWGMPPEGNGFKFEIVRAAASVKKFNLVSYIEVAPRGGTPLYDAIGRMTDIIASDKGELGTLMILTDGEENSSKTVNKDGAKVRLDVVRARGWDVIQIGVEFDAYQQAASVGTQAQFVGNATLHAMQSGNAAEALSLRSSAYYQSGQSVGFTSAQKAMLET